ncbi:MAG: hypothetical protein O3A95_07000 [Planctomycetota bacterium]|nr:hypothetical protein [Planctomycetota bacterium]MDA1114031.1 hypothetical protein [Planctomycetota bacterium]
MKLSTTLLLAALLLPTLGSCGGGESVDPPADSDSDSATAPVTETVTEQAPAKIEEAAKTESGMDQLEALENQATGAVEAAKEATKEVVISKAAQALFDSYCVTCHGKTGKGDGIAAAGLPVKPASFTDAAWQASVTDEHLALVIAEGGAAAGKSPLMVAAPGAKDNPELLNGLVAIVRAFGE